MENNNHTFHLTPLSPGLNEIKYLKQKTKCWNCVSKFYFQLNKKKEKKLSPAQKFADGKHERERPLVPTMHGNVGMEKNQWKVQEDDTVIVDPSDKEQVI